MKYLFFLAIIAATVFTSCQKCATCTFTEPDGSILESDFCYTNRIYDNTLNAHEKTGWICVEE